MATTMQPKGCKTQMQLTLHNTAHGSHKIIHNQFRQQNSSWITQTQPKGHNRAKRSQQNSSWITQTQPKGHNTEKGQVKGQIKSGINSIKN